MPRESLVEKRIPDMPLASRRLKAGRSEHAFLNLKDWNLRQLPLHYGYITRDAGVHERGILTSLSILASIQQPPNPI